MNEPPPGWGSKIDPGGIRLSPEAPVRGPGRLGRGIRHVWNIVRRAVKKFLQIDGDQWAGAFAFNAFFSLFPLVVLMVSIASAFIEKDQATKEIIASVESYVPIGGQMQSYIFDTIAGVVNARGKAGVLAFLILVWTAIQCFTTLICATNLAWGTKVNSWWRLPLKSLALLSITTGAVVLGMALPILVRLAKGWLFAENDFHSWVYDLGTFFVPWLVVFFSLSLFYRLAPHQPKRFVEVWVAALCATVLLQAAEGLFVIYLKDFATLNAVYGAFGGIMALLLWIYLSGGIFIFGACLCAVRAEGAPAPAQTVLARSPGAGRRGQQ